MKARRRLTTTHNALDLIEEAVHTLRLAPAATLLCYYVGSAPFVLGALYFWSEMSRSGLAEENLVGGAVRLTLLFIWMKLWQCAFTRRLSAQIAHAVPEKLRAGTVLRAAGAQTLLHGTAFFLLPAALIVLVPFVWLFGFYQNATVFGLRDPALRPLARRSWKQACHSVGQSHRVVITLLLFGHFVFFNVAVLILAAPHLLRVLFGVESHSTLSVLSSLNTTFLATALGVTYLCLDPLIKAVFTLRCFYGEARATGEDLRVSLRSFRAPAIALLLCLLTIASFDASAATAARPPATEEGAQLDRTIEKILERPDYTWREPREKTARVKEDRAWPMWERIENWMKKTVQSFGDWLDKLFRSKPPTPGVPRNWSFSADGFKYIAIFIIAAAALFVAWYLWRTRSRRMVMEAEAMPAAPQPDLTSEDVAGDELPVDGWTALALELLERGELRLAMRAFYFSSLAHLAARNLVNIAKFKSNRDYERELHRRSHALPGLTRSFSDNVSIFDRVWYGMHEINADVLQQFRGNVERIREC